MPIQLWSPLETFPVPPPQHKIISDEKHSYVRLPGRARVDSTLHLRVCMYVRRGVGCEYVGCFRLVDRHGLGGVRFAVMTAVGVVRRNGVALWKEEKGGGE